MDIAFEDASSVGNIKIGIVSNGGITVVSGETGHFGVSDSSDFSSSLAASPLSTHFTGLNSTGTSGDANNVSIGNRNSAISNYIYLDIETSSSRTTAGNGAYKVFFDYS